MFANAGYSLCMSKSRPVKIETECGSHLVKYTDRVKGGRHFAAQFNTRDNSLEKVKAWIENNPKIHLI